MMTRQDDRVAPRLVILGVVGIVALMVLISMDKMSSALGQTSSIDERKIQVEINFDDFASKIEKISKVANSNQEKNKKNKLKNNQDTTLPAPDNLAGGSKVWDFLYEHANFDLIEDTDNEEEEKQLKISKYQNIIQYIIQFSEAERADEWLTQLVIWFHKIAVGWPSSTSINLQNEDKFIDVLERIIKLKDGNSNGTISADEVRELVKNEIDTGMVGEIAAKKFMPFLNSPSTTLTDWDSQIRFAVGMERVAPVFEEYEEKWQAANISSVEAVVFEMNQGTKDNLMEEAASLLEILSAACDRDEYVGKVLYTTLNKLLLEEEAEEKDTTKNDPEPEPEKKAEEEKQIDESEKINDVDEDTEDDDVRFGDDGEYDAEP